jgi:biotin transport system substrate-specific component
LATKNREKMMNTTLAQRALPLSNATVRNILLAVAGSLLVAAAAQVKIPFWPVPVTLQTLAVLLVGGAYGARLGAATLGLYALEGAVGLPFFAGGKAGLFDDKLAYFLPASSMGYVAGFVLAAALVGYLAQTGWINSAARMVMATLAGAVVLYVPGLLWLGDWAMITQGFDVATAAQKTLEWGLYPFVYGDALKAAIAGLGLSAGWSALQR